MQAHERDAFFAEESDLNLEDHLVFTYLIESDGDVYEAAANLAREQSTAQWQRPGIDEDFRPLHAAKVVSVELLDTSVTSALNQESAPGVRFQRASIRIAHPHRNFGPRIPNLLTVAMGEGAFFSHGVTSVKLMDIAFPESFLAHFEGPRYGTRGIRELLGAWDRPLFFGVVKPNVGLDPASFTHLAKEAWLGGLDVAKDDEMLSDPEYSPFHERMRRIGIARREAEAESGERKLFVANVTDEIDRMYELAEIAAREQVGAVMVNVMALGLSAVRMLRRRTELPIIAHFDCIAPMARHPLFGVATTVFTKLQRLCGCDAIIMPGFGERMMTADEEVLANANECTASLGSIAAALPVPGGSDWAGTLAKMVEKLRTIDFAMVPGRGVFGHPSGPRAGAASLRQAWEAIVHRMPIEELARERTELREAIEAFGKRTQDPLKLITKMPAFGFTGAHLIFHQN